MKINKKEYPLKVLESFVEITEDLRKIAASHSTIVIEKKGHVLNENSDTNETELLRFEFIEERYNFYFTVDSMRLFQKPSYTPHTKYYYCKRPNNDTTLAQKTGDQKSAVVLSEFKNWISLIERYESISFSDPIIESYKNEIFSKLEILEDEANSEPFDINQQVSLLKYFQKSIELVSKEDEDEETEDLISEIEKLKRDITKVSKNRIMSQLSTVLAKSKKHGIILYKGLLIMFEKDVLRDVKDSGREYFLDLIKQLKQIK